MEKLTISVHEGHGDIWKRRAAEAGIAASGVPWSVSEYIRRAVEAYDGAQAAPQDLQGAKPPRRATVEVEAPADQGQSEVSDEQEARTDAGSIPRHRTARSHASDPRDVAAHTEGAANGAETLLDGEGVYVRLGSGRDRKNLDDTDACGGGALKREAKAPHPRESDPAAPPLSYLSDNSKLPPGVDRTALLPLERGRSGEEQDPCTLRWKAPSQETLPIAPQPHQSVRMPVTKESQTKRGRR